jgi:hypothetical protein
LFVYLTEAYDIVPIAKLWESLKKTDIHLSIIKAIENLTHTKIPLKEIKVDTKLSAGFLGAKGLRQRCISNRLTS